MKCLSKKTFSTGLLVALLSSVLLFGSSAVSADLVIPHTFEPNTVISSSQMNANFLAMKNAIDALGASPGIDYDDGAYPAISTWAIRGGNPESTTLKHVSLIAPANGFIVVSVTGTGCLFDAGQYIELWLSDNADNSAFHYVASYAIFSIANNTGAPQACGVGQYNTFSFQYVRPVTASATYTFYLKGHRGNSQATGNLDISPLQIVYYPIRY